MELLNLDNLLKMSENWLPLLLNYAGKVTLALITLLLGWWLINLLVRKMGRLLDGRQPSWPVCCTKGMICSRFWWSKCRPDNL